MSDDASTPAPCRTPWGPWWNRSWRGSAGASGPRSRTIAIAIPTWPSEIREIFPALVEMEQVGLAGDPPLTSHAGAAALAPERLRRWRGSRPRMTASSSESRALGDYKILRGSAAGGWGWSTRPSTSALKSRVALKVIHPRFRADENYLRRFHVEARAAARLHHTNIVSVFDYGEQDGVCYYAMQYIAGPAATGPRRCDRLDEKRPCATGSTNGPAPRRDRRSSRPGRTRLRRTQPAIRVDRPGPGPVDSGRRSRPATSPRGGLPRSSGAPQRTEAKAS